ncbi:MAG: 7TM-DISM domain-containing protein, partial [Spirochaetia bacterium]|nr:7TM-DISM domain-containing protein [Spirochaetia bacterium]
MDRDVAFLNGKEFGRTGDWDSPQPQGYDKHRLYEVPDQLWRPGRNVLLLHVRGFFPKEIGIYRNTTQIGPSQKLRRDYMMTDFISALFFTTYLTAGGYFLFLFLRRRAERENLFFGLFTILFVAYQFMRTQLKYEMGIDFAVMKRVEYMLLYALMTPFYYFLRYTFRLPNTKFMLWLDRFMYVPLLGVAALCIHTLLTSSPVQWSDANAHYLQNIIWPAYLSVSLGLMIYQIRRGDRDALYMIIGILVMMAAMIVDMLSNKGIINVPRVLGYAFSMFILSLALILANRFVRLNEQVEDLNRNLETKVSERTEQLQKTLEEVRALKVQQDGDYFLTSLLIGPLGGNFTKSKTVSTEILVRQKKKFQFKRWSAEIGGDLCVAQTIQLRGRTYTVFLNGDAMGKSIQGAGGALVLGTVFKAILTRTEMSSGAQERYPEQWLKECFV